MPTATSDYGEPTTEAQFIRPACTPPATQPCKPPPVTMENPPLSLSSYDQHAASHSRERIAAASASKAPQRQPLQTDRGDASPMHRAPSTRTSQTRALWPRARARGPRRSPREHGHGAASGLRATTRSTAARRR